MRRIAALASKEVLLLLRDVHALALLFVMPVAFILVMSLALQNTFAAHGELNVSWYALNQDAMNPDSAALLARLGELEGFRALPGDAPEAALRERVRRGEALFLVTLPPGFSARLASPNPLPLRIWATASVDAATWHLFQASVQGAVVAARLERERRSAAVPTLFAPSAQAGTPQSLVIMRSLHGAGGERQMPSSVQHNVPAWLLFAMFFIAVPLSTTWVQERHDGTYARLRSMGIGGAQLLLGKLVPYVVLNLLQVLAMLLVGVYLLPRLGGEALTLGHSLGGLALIIAAASFAAVAWALLVANLVSSSEQATLFTGVANLLMAALGGIMVPRFLMPLPLQELSAWSPMAWGLDGFLDIFLRDGGVVMVAPAAARLAAFAGVCLALAAWRMHARRGR